MSQPQLKFNFCKRNSHITAIENSLKKIKAIHQDARESITSRYITLLEDYNHRKQRYSISFHSLRFIVTVGSLIVPAVLSVQYTNGNVDSTSANLPSQVYWIVWTLSLFVTISNGIMTLLKMDKKYHSLHSTFEQLISEGWQYVHLAGKYNGRLTPGVDVTHESQFQFFCFYIEKVRMKQIEDEYYKSEEQKETTTTSEQFKTPHYRSPFASAPQQSSQQEVNESTVTVRSNASSKE
jgi:hypothetical protein